MIYNNKGSNIRSIIMFIALFIVVLLTPIESVSIGGDDSRFSVVKLSVLFVFTLWAVFGFHYNISRLLRSYITIFVFFILTLILSINLEHSLNRLLLMLLPTLLLCAIIDYYVNTRERLRWIIIAYTIGAVILSVYAYYNRAEILMNAVNEYNERVSALGHDENEMSYLLVLGITCCLHLFSISKNLFIKFIFIVCIIIFIFFTVLTGSRTGMIIMFLVFALYAINSLRSKKSRFGLVIVGMLLLIFAVYFISFIPESTIERLLQTRDLVSSGDMSGRGDIWSIGFNAFIDGNFITGVGYDNFMNRFAEYTGKEGRAAHNTYLSFLVCGGVIGFILFVYLLVLIWKECVKVYKLSGNIFVFAYYIPLLITMFTLETTDRRWIYIIGIMIYKWRQILVSKATTNQIKTI